jgi:pyruvate,orthophosphate dikinase
MTFGFSRDDIGTFLPDYLDKEILPGRSVPEPRQEGVGQLVEMASSRPRRPRPTSRSASAASTAATPSP